MVAVHYYHYQLYLVVAFLMVYRQVDQACMMGKLVDQAGNQAVMVDQVDNQVGLVGILVGEIDLVHMIGRVHKAPGKVDLADKMVDLADMEIDLVGKVVDLVPQIRQVSQVGKMDLKKVLHCTMALGGCQTEDNLSVEGKKVLVQMAWACLACLQSIDELKFKNIY